MDIGEYDEYLRKVKAYQSLGNHSYAIDMLNSLIEEGNDNLIVWNLKGLAHMNLLQLKEALESFDNALSLDPMNYISLINKGNVLFELEKFKGALICFNKALEFNPTDSNVLNLKGVCYINLSKFKEALDCFNDSYELNPFNPKTIQYKKNAEKALGIQVDEDFGSETVAYKKTAFSNKPNIPLMERNRDIDGLMRALNDHDVYIRRNSVKALGRLKDRKAISALETSLNIDKDKLVIKLAQKALDNIN